MVSESLPPLLRLPVELRQQIYSYLIVKGNVSHPLPSVGITSVSYNPPGTALLTIHPTVSAEIIDYFYSIATWKIVLSHAFNFFRVDPNLDRLEQCPNLQRMRRVEVVFFQDILLLKEYPSFGLEKFCAEIRRRADRACDVLLQASKLRCVVVSWIDTTPTGGWAEKHSILEPLRKLSEKVQFRVGEVVGPDKMDVHHSIAAIGDESQHDYYQTDTDKPAQGSPTHLRMLAFDVRQDREALRAMTEGEQERHIPFNPCSQRHGTGSWTGGEDDFFRKK